MKVAISLLTYNDLIYLKPCIESLVKSDIMEHNIKLFIIDNNSNIEMKEYIDKIPLNKWVYYNNTNQGIVIPRIEIMNKILEETYDYTLELHADMLFPQNWFNELVKLMDNDTAIVMPFILTNPNIILNIDKLNELIDIYKKDTVYYNTRQVHPWLLNNTIIKKIGYYDSQFSPQNCEDDDLIWNIMKNNYKTKATKNSIVVHYGGKTRTLANIQYNLDKSFNLFYNKNKITVNQLVEKFSLHPVIIY
jgi:GT2 family glycosyltransferase